MEQVKTVVADDYDFAEQQAYLLFLQRPRVGDTFATQGDYYTLTGGWQGVYPAGDTPVLRSVPMPLRNGHDEAVLSTDELLAELEHIRWCRYHYLNQPPARRSTPSFWGRSPSSAGSRPFWTTRNS